MNKRLFFIFTNFAVTALSTATFDQFLKRADEGCSFNTILYLFPYDDAIKTMLSFPYLIVLVWG